MKRLVCVAQFFNENTHKGHDGLTNLDRFLSSISRYCDGLVLYNDGSTDEFMDLINEYQGVDRLQEINVIGDKENDFKNELYHKARLLEHSKRFNPDWLIWLDCDEVVQYDKEQEIQGLIENSSADGINLFERNLWRTEKAYRTDELWAQGLFCRLWKMQDSLSYTIKRGLHFSLVPDGVVKREDVKDLFVVHYGYSTDEAILRKYNMYKSHGQSGNPLNRMIDERTLRIAQSPAAWFSDISAPHGPEPIDITTPLVTKAKALSIL